MNNLNNIINSTNLNAKTGLLKKTATNNKIISQTNNYTNTIQTTGSNIMANYNKHIVKTRFGHKLLPATTLQESRKVLGANFDEVISGVFRSSNPVVLSKSKSEATILNEKNLAEINKRFDHIKKLDVDTVINLQSPESREKFINAKRCEPADYWSDLNNEKEQCQQKGINFYRGAINSQDFDITHSVIPTVKHITDKLDQNKKVLIHCYSGKDRTGLIAGTLQILSGDSLKNVLSSHASQETPTSIRSCSKVITSLMKIDEHVNNTSRTDLINDYLDYYHKLPEVKKPKNKEGNTYSAKELKNIFDNNFNNKNDDLSLTDKKELTMLSKKLKHQ